jgi:hypothetical protein
LCDLHEKYLSVPDWTAEDYALMGGHQEIAAELKSPSEKMVMSFTEKNIKSQECYTGKAPSERSVSDVCLPPDQQEQEKEVRALSVVVCSKNKNKQTPWSESASELY